MAIQHRRGNESDFVAGKMLPGELAVTTDGSKKAWIAFGAGDVKEFAFQDDIPLKISELENDEEFIKNTVTDLKNYYLKSETYTQEEIKQLISVLPKYSVVVVDSLPLVGDLEKIYLLKVGDEEGNLFDEYIYVNSKWERIGSQRIDLSNYVTKQEAEKLSNDINSNSELIKTKANAIHPTATGTTIVATDSSEGAPEGLNVYGKSTQETTTGKNKFNSLIVADRTHNGIQTTRNEDGTIHISGTSTTGARYIKSDDNEFLRLPAGTYTITPTNFKIEITGGNGRTESGTFTISEETGFKNAYFSFDTTTNQNQTIGIQIEEGTVATPYEPYTGGIPSPNPEYPQPIESVGDDGSVEVGVYGGNLLPYPYTFNTSTTGGLTYTANDDGSITVTGTKTGTSYFNLIGGIINDYSTEKIVFSETIYTLIENGYRLSARLTDGTYINGITTDNIKNKPIGALYVESTHANNTVINDVIHPLISYANIKEWKPYTKQSLTIPYTLCGIPVTDASLANYTDDNGQMWCADEVDFERGVYIQRVGVVKPDDWEKTNIADGTSGHRYRAFVPTIKGVRTPLLSNCYVAKSVSSFGTEGDYLSIDETSSCKAVIRTTDEKLGTIDKFKAFANEKNMKVYCILATPIEIPLTSEELEAYKALTMNYPTTTILTNNGAEMKVSYVADLPNHIEQNYVPVSEFKSLVNRVIALEKNAV